MTSRHQKQIDYRRKGETLISLVVTSFMVAFVILELIAILSLYNTQGGYLWARMDTFNSANNALQLLGQRIRSARNLGELYGQVPPPSQPVVLPTGPGPINNPNIVDGTQIPVLEIENGMATLTSATFPSLGDPLYGPGGQMVASTNWPWGATSYTLSATTLVLQVPVFDSNGFPLSLAPAFYGAPPLSALDTYVYNIWPNPTNNPGPYSLQMSYFPAPSPSWVPINNPYSADPTYNAASWTLTNVPSSIQPGTVTTVLTGIVGPKDRNNNLSIFQYVEKNTNLASSTVDPMRIQNYSGVIINLEIVNQDGTGRSSILPFKSEMYMRNNVAATTIGAPPNN